MNTTTYFIAQGYTAGDNRGDGGCDDVHIVGVETTREAATALLEATEWLNRGTVLEVINPFVLNGRRYTPLPTRHAWRRPEAPKARKPRAKRAVKRAR